MEYYPNMRAGNMTVAALLVAASAIFSFLVLTGYLLLPAWLVLAPAGYVAGRMFLYTLVRNAVRESIVLAEKDLAMAEDGDDPSILTPGFYAERAANGVTD